MQTQLDDIDYRLGDDRRIRTRHIRRDAPERITNTLGALPPGGEPSRAWDVAAGHLDQHQTAYGLSKGLGPTRGPKLPIGFLHSRSIAKATERNFEQAITLQRRRALEREGPVMRIGR